MLTRHNYNVTSQIYSRYVQIQPDWSHCYYSQNAVETETLYSIQYVNSACHISSCFKWIKPSEEALQMPSKHWISRLRSGNQRIENESLTCELKINWTKKISSTNKVIYWSYCKLITKSHFSGPQFNKDLIKAATSARVGSFPSDSHINNLSS